MHLQIVSLYMIIGRDSVQSTICQVEGLSNITIRLIRRLDVNLHDLYSHIHSSSDVYCQDISDD